MQNITNKKNRFLKLEENAREMRKKVEKYYSGDVFNKIVPLMAWAEINNRVNLEFVCDIFVYGYSEGIKSTQTEQAEENDNISNAKIASQKKKAP